MKIETFWSWLLKGSENSGPGLKNIINRFLVVHIFIAVLLVVLIPANPFEFAKTAVFPAASILIGLSLAWTTRATNILQDSEFRKKLLSDSRSIADYIYGYQLAILTIIVMISYVCIMAAGGTSIVIFGNYRDDVISEFGMYFFISLALRECWGAINFTNMLAILGYKS